MKMGIKPYYTDKWVTIYHGDCKEVLPQISSKSVNLVCVDLPYNVGKAYKSDLVWDKWDNLNDYINWCGGGFRETQRVLKDNGSFYFFHNNFPTICELQQWIRNNTKLFFRQFIVWNKRFDGAKNKSYLDGYIAEDRIYNYYKMAEYILFYTFDNHWKIKEEREKRGIKQVVISEETKSCNGNLTGWFSNIETGKYFPTQETIKPITKHLGLTMDDLVYTFNNQKKHHSCWNYSIEEKTLHPTQKPIGLIENIIKHSSNECEVVLDYTAGTGTVGVACKKTNRVGILIEISEKYCEIAAKRCSQEVMELNI